MNFACALPLLLLALPVGAAGPNLTGVTRVYMLPMGNGLDQHLANHLTRAGLFNVVTEPLGADAVFTDRLGLVFEQRLAEIYPEERKKQRALAEAEAAAAKGKDAKAGEASPSLGMTGDFGGDARPISSLSRGKGNVFLVDLRSREVLWSDFHRLKDTRPTTVDRAAERLVKKLAKDVMELRSDSGIVTMPSSAATAPVSIPPPAAAEVPPSPPAAPAPPPPAAPAAPPAPAK